MRQGLITFIHNNRNGLREMVSDFDEKMRSATWERCTRVNMRMIETAPFCTSLLERTLNAQARLEESVRQQHGVDCSLRRLLTEVYEASAGLSEHESPSVRDPPKAHLRPLSPRCRLLARRSMSYACLQPHGAVGASTGRGSPTCPRWRFRPPRIASPPTTSRARCSFGSSEQGLSTLEAVT